MNQSINQSINQSFAIPTFPQIPTPNLPIKLSLVLSVSANAPNPFGSSTSVNFFAPKTGDVMIGVYDMLGNLVKELTNETYDSGMYTLKFNSNDVAPGTYFMRMTASGYSVTNTMNIVK